MKLPVHLTTIGAALFLLIATPHIYAADGDDKDKKEEAGDKKKDDKDKDGKKKKKHDKKKDDDKKGDDKKGDGKKGDDDKK
jgi:hypothetical protein